MKTIQVLLQSAVLLLCVLLPGCSGNKSINTEELKKEFGAFTATYEIRKLPMDYSNAPIMNKINHHPEQFRYLENVNLWRISYRSNGHFITGFMATPKAPGKYPCIIYNRGGNRDYGALLYATAVETMGRLAAAGYVVAGSNYRGNSGSEGLEQFGGSDVQDVLDLILSLQSVEEADTSRVGLLGISRGGMMNYLALKQNAGLRCVVSIGGISNMETTIKYHPEIKTVCEELIPDFKTNPAGALRKRSAVYWCDSLPATAPLLILHGTADDHVHYSQSVQFADSLEKHQRPYKLVSFDNDDHGINNHREQAEQLTLEWFEKYLKKAAPFSEPEKRTVIR